MVFIAGSVPNQAESDFSVRARIEGQLRCRTIQVRTDWKLVLNSTCRAESFPAARTESMDEAEQKLKPIRVILETIRERADYALKTTSGCRRGAFNAMEVQRVPVCEIFYSCSVDGNSRKMPPLQGLFI